MSICRIHTPAALLALFAATAAPALPPAAAVEPAAAPPPPAASAARLPPVSADQGSYDVGLLFGSQLEHNGLGRTVSIDAVMRGLKEALAGRALSADERETAVRFMREARDALAEKNRAAGHEFLERNAKESGVQIMPSGLQYRIIAAGDAAGRSPLATDQVTVRYRASLIDGTEFDRSDAHDRPATFRVNSVFKGWQEAFLAMKPGAKWQLFVPPELGYGANSPPGVPPGAVLVYELELLRIEAPPAIDPTMIKSPPRGKGAAAPASKP